MGQQINSSNDYHKDTFKPRRSPRLAPNSAYNQTFDPFDSLFYRPVSSHNRYNVFSEDPRHGWDSNFYAPRSSFFLTFWTIYNLLIFIEYKCKYISLQHFKK